MPLIKRFNRTKFKGFSMQIRLKIQYKRVKLFILFDQVTYTGLFLLRQALE